jgi:hypothetical protein
MPMYSPTAEHQMLKRLTGAWSAHIKRYEPGSTKAEESTGEFLARMDLGGLFLHRDMNFGIQGFQGRGLTGWDPFQKAFVGTWVDSGGPIIYRTIAQFDERGVYCEESSGPDLDGTPVRVRMTTNIVDKDQMLFQLFHGVENSEEYYLALEIEHTRRRFGG